MRRSKKHSMINSANDFKAVLYRRVSTDKQAKDGNSLDDQEERLRAEAKRRGVTDIIELVDDESGKDTRRKALKQAFQLLNSGQRNLLIVTKLDRLSRSLRDILNIAFESQKAGWHIIVLDGSITFDTTTFEGKSKLYLMGLLAEYEREQISKRMYDSYAYRRRRNDDGLIGKDIEKQVLKDFKAGASMNAIAADLNKRGVKTARGGKWYASTIERILTRAKNLGDLAGVAVL